MAEEKQLRVKLIKSTTGQKQNAVRTVHALGLKKINDTNDLVDNSATRGMVDKVSHLLEIEEIEE